jgi:type IV secretion system protein VirB2
MAKRWMRYQEKLGAFFLGLWAWAYASAALASTSGGLPWDGPVTTLKNDLTGPIATGISVVAFLAAGAALVFGEELGGIAKKALFVVMGVAMIVMGNQFLSALGLTGATI